MEDYISVLYRTFGDQKCKEDDTYEPPQKAKSKGKSYTQMWKDIKKQAGDIDYLGMTPHT